MGIYRCDSSNCLKKEIFILFFFLFMVVFISTIINADVVSINSGGSNEFAVTTDRYIEGFFFGLQEPIEAPPDPPDPSDPSDPSGPEEPVIRPLNIAIVPTEFNIDMQISTNIERTIKITNLELSEINLQISQQDLTNMVILGETNLTIRSGQTVELDVIFVAPSTPGIYTGKIFIGSREVLVALNVRSVFLLFDSNIVVLNEDFIVYRGEKLETMVTIIPMGDPSRIDVTLDYVIKDYKNNVFLTKSETLLVQNQTQILRDFDIGLLSFGDYIVGLEVKYPTGADPQSVAPSSAHFTVVKKPLFWRIILFLVISILIILIIIIIILIIKRLKERKDEEKQKTTSSTTAM